MTPFFCGRLIDLLPIERDPVSELMNVPSDGVPKDRLDAA